MANIFGNQDVTSVNGKRGRVEVIEDRNVLYTQSVASDVWTIEHNMGKYPTVTIMDSAGNRVIGEEEHVDVNTVILTFNGAFTGKATLN